MKSKKRTGAYMLLTHAIQHCQYGSAPIDRTPDIGDLLAVKILTDLRAAIAKELVA